MYTRIGGAGGRTDFYSSAGWNQVRWGVVLSLEYLYMSKLGVARPRIRRPVHAWIDVSKYNNVWRFVLTNSSLFRQGVVNLETPEIY